MKELELSLKAGKAKEKALEKEKATLKSQVWNGILSLFPHKLHIILQWPNVFGHFCQTPCAHPCIPAFLEAMQCRLEVPFKSIYTWNHCRPFQHCLGGVVTKAVLCDQSTRLVKLSCSKCALQLLCNNM